MKIVRMGLLIGTLISLGSALTVRAQAKPDFSGTWKMDPTRSESAAQKEPIGPVTVVIAQTADEVKIETTRVDGSSAVTYKIDGSETRVPEGTAKTHWDGATLVTEVERYVQGQAVTTKEVRKLAANGNEMLVNMTVIGQHGYSASTTNYGSGKDVYVRSR